MAMRGEKFGSARGDSGAAKGQGDPKTRSGASRGMGSDVGNETKADMRGAQLGQPEDHNPLRGATRELKAQHPIEYHEHGPHHGTTHHIRHEPMHGMHVKASHGRKRG